MSIFAGGAAVGDAGSALFRHAKHTRRLPWKLANMSFI
jgi:hypothetical protein